MMGINIAYEKINSNAEFLAHYGLKGQKWYVNQADRFQYHAKYAKGVKPSERNHDERVKYAGHEPEKNWKKYIKEQAKNYGSRYQNEERSNDFVLPSGEEIRRISAYLNESKKNRYFSYDDVDAYYYKSVFKAYLNENLGKNKEIYEHVYKLKDDIRVASYKEAKKAIDEMSNQKSFANELGKHLLYKSANLKFEVSIDKIKSIGEGNPNNLKKISGVSERKQKEITKYLSDKGDEYHKKAETMLKNKSDNFYAQSMQMFATNKKYMNVFRDALQKKGYDAVFDLNNSGQEKTRSAIKSATILFDPNKHIQKVKSQPLTKKVVREAERKWDVYYDAYLKNQKAIARKKRIDKVKSFLK